MIREAEAYLKVAAGRIDEYEEEANAAGDDDKKKQVTTRSSLAEI